MWKQEHWSALLLRPVEEAQAKTLGHTLGDEETNILVKMVSFKLQVVAGALVDHSVFHSSRYLGHDTLRHTRRCVRDHMYGS